MGTKIVPVANIRIIPIINNANCVLSFAIMRLDAIGQEKITLDFNTSLFLRFDGRILYVRSHPVSALMCQ